MKKEEVNSSDFDALVPDNPRLGEEQTDDPSSEFDNAFYAGMQDIAELERQVVYELRNIEEKAGPSIFWAAGILSRAHCVGRLLKIEPLGEGHLFRRLVHGMKWWNFNKKGKRQFCTPPAGLIRSMINTSQADSPYPILKRVVSAPVFVARQDGSVDLLKKAGFDSESGIYHQETLDGLSVPDAVTKEEMKEAVRFINEELIPDFPFHDQADRANAIGLLILPFVRHLIDGPTPLHSVQAPVPSSGKGKLIRTLLEPGLTKQQVQETVFPEREEELQKVICTGMAEAVPMLWFDNVRGDINSPSLEMALTGEYFSGRLLGKNLTVKEEPKMIWVMAANNPSFVADIQRRICRIRLRPPTDRPEDRPASEFKHPRQMAWVRTNRAQIVKAVYTIVLDWIQAGRPDDPDVTFASYEAWAGIIGGILKNAGISGFMKNHLVIREAEDAERQARGVLFNDWWEKIQTEAEKPIEQRNWHHRMTSGELFELAKDIDGLRLHGNAEHQLKTSFGKWLAGCSDLRPTHIERDDDGRVLYVRVFEITKPKRSSKSKKSQPFEISLVSEERFYSPEEEIRTYPESSVKTVSGQQTIGAFNQKDVASSAAIEIPTYSDRADLDQEVF
jgi:hypothetical protein